MSWTTTTNTNLKVGDKVKIVSTYKELFDKTFTIRYLTLNKELCVLKELTSFKVLRTKHLKPVNNNLEIE